MSAFRQGEWILLSSQRGKKWLVKVEDAPFSSHLGTIQMREVLHKEEGEFLETNKGAKIFLQRPTLEDYIFQMERKTQVIYPKDLGAIILYGDIRPGDTVLESGVGSGALTLTLLRAVSGGGRVISVEKRPEFAALALDNICKFWGERPAHLHLVVADIQAAGLTVLADRAVLDLPEPWQAIRHICPLLKQGGVVVTLSPNVGQIQLTYRELKSHGFFNITTFELLRREWMVDELRARPKDRMVAHTGFLTVAKKGRPPAVA